MKKKLFIYFLIIFSAFLYLKKDYIKASENIKNASIAKTFNKDYLKQIPSSEYIIGQADELKLIISRDYPELNSIALVNGEGQINIPLLKNVYVSGLTIDELTQLLNEAYKEYVKYPELEIYIQNYRPINIKMVGEIENPGFHKISGALSINEQRLLNNNFISSQISNSSDSSLSSKTFLDSVNLRNLYFPTVFDAIKKAGGITEYSDLKNIKLIRKSSISQGGGKKSTTLNFEDVLDNVDSNLNLRIYDGDTIIISRLENPNSKEIFKKAVLSNLNPKFIDVFITGRVNNPGPTTLSKASVLTDAIDLAGGTKALKGPIRFVRYNKDGTVAKRKFSYRPSAKRGSYKNPVLRNGDLIVVGNSVVNITTEVITEVTAPFVGLFSTYALIEAVSN